MRECRGKPTVGGYVHLQPSAPSIYRFKRRHVSFANGNFNTTQHDLRSVEGRNAV